MQKIRASMACGEKHVVCGEEKCCWNSVAKAEAMWVGADLPAALKSKRVA